MTNSKDKKNDNIKEIVLDLKIKKRKNEIMSKKGKSISIQELKKNIGVK